MIGIGTPPTRAAVIGAGVIGAAWAARLRLRGVHVQVYDPSPLTADLLAVVEADAIAAWELLDLPTSSLGELDVCSSIADAVHDAELIQESVPERLDLKHEILREIERDAPIDAVIASSTSGFRPTALAQPLEHPARLVVAHPFNPVYLLPLVEIVGGEHTAPLTIEWATGAYRSLGMHPIHVRHEIDAFIADRLMEAMWREALWLVHDGIATTGEIDDVIRFGFGLRWAQMGLFETYRIAGGEGGMAAFLAQFGPALEWPWTKLTETPELTSELIDRIARQSDDQAAGRSTRELARQRDRNLVAILRALESEGAGAGHTVATLRAAIEAGH